MKKRQPTLLESALQAQIKSVQTALDVLANAVQLAEDQHSAETREIEQRRRDQGIEAERIFDVAAKPIEEAWQKIFGAALRARYH